MIANLTALLVLLTGSYIVAGVVASFILVDLSGFDFRTWHIAGRCIFAAASLWIFLSWLNAIRG